MPRIMMQLSFRYEPQYDWTIAGIWVKHKTDQNPQEQNCITGQRTDLLCADGVPSNICKHHDAVPVRKMKCWKQQPLWEKRHETKWNKYETKAFPITDIERSRKKKEVWIRKLHGSYQSHTASLDNEAEQGEFALTFGSMWQHPIFIHHHRHACKEPSYVRRKALSRRCIAWCGTRRRKTVLSASHGLANAQVLLRARKRIRPRRRWDTRQSARATVRLHFSLCIGQLLGKGRPLAECRAVPINDVNRNDQEEWDADWYG